MRRDSEAMTIGALALAAGVGVETVRFYQRRGLLGVPRRPTQGIRWYGQAELARLLFIRRAQRLGFTLKEVTDLLRLESETSCTGTRALAQERLSDVRQRLADLADIQATLERLVEACSDSGASGACPILAALNTDSAALPARGNSRP